MNANTKSEEPIVSALDPMELEIRNHPFLKDLSPHQYRILADSAMQSHFRKGEVIFRQGDPANRFYLIQHGKISVEAWLPGGKSRVIQTLSDGEVLGWSWMFPPFYWQFSARAIEPIEAIFIYGTPLREECETDHELGYELMKRLTEVVVQRLQATRRQLAGLPETWIGGA
jgi:CRP/FNR family cyclic AMP-dependent transcriptional regulator